MFVTTADGVDLWWELEGDGPAVLLVPGRGDATDLFPEELTAQLRAAGLATLRFDPRDTGRSGDGGSTYTVSTMADDAVAVLDAATVDAAHLVGVSMGGFVLAHLAHRHPARVRSLAFVSAISPDGDAGMGEDFFAALDAVDPIELLVGAMGDVSDADRTWAAALVAAGERHAPARPEAAARHQDAAFRLEWPTLDDLASVRVPTFVVHGELDRTLPVAHAQALADRIPGASLTVVPGMGHLPRPADWAAIGDRIVRQAAAG